MLIKLREALSGYWSVKNRCFYFGAFTDLLKQKKIPALSIIFINHFDQLPNKIIDYVGRYDCDYIFFHILFSLLALCIWNLWAGYWLLIGTYGLMCWCLLRRRRGWQQSEPREPRPETSAWRSWSGSRRRSVAFILKIWRLWLLITDQKETNGISWKSAVQLYCFSCSPMFYWRTIHWS